MPSTAKSIYDEVDYSESTEDLKDAEILEIKNAKLVKLHQNIQNMRHEIQNKLVSIKECRSVVDSAKKLVGELNGSFKRK